MNARAWLAAAARLFDGEASPIFVIGYLLAFPRYLYADLCVQLEEGRRIWAGEFPRTIPHAIEAYPRVDHEWLFEAAAWPFWAHGIFPVFAFLCPAAVAATPLLARALARRCGASPWAANAVAYLTIPGVVTSYAVRPQTFAVIAFGLTLYALLGSLERPWKLGLVVAVWANLHGTATLAPATVALVAGMRLVAGGAPEMLRRFGVALAVSALATLATPLGIGLYLGASGYAPSTQQTEDWQPLFLAYPPDYITLVLLGYVLISGGVRVSREHAVPTALLGAYGLLWFCFSRFMPFFDLAATPALAVALRRDGSAQGRRTRRPRPVTGPAPSPLLIAVPVAIALLAASALLAPLATKPTPTAAAADDLVGRAGFAGRAFVPFEAAAYLDFRERPVSFLLDSRGTDYPPSAWADWRRISDARAGWDATLVRRGISGAVVADDSAIASALAASPRWAGCLRTAGWALYVLADARNASADRRTPGLRCKPWTGASSPTPTPSSSPPSRTKSGVRSTISS